MISSNTTKKHTLHRSCNVVTLKKINTVQIKHKVRLDKQDLFLRSTLNIAQEYMGAFQTSTMKMPQTPRAHFLKEETISPYLSVML